MVLLAEASSRVANELWSARTGGSAGDPSAVAGGTTAATKGMGLELMTEYRWLPLETDAEVKSVRSPSMTIFPFVLWTGPVR